MSDHPPNPRTAERGGPNHGEPVRQPVRPAETVRDAVRPTEPVRQSVRSAEAIREPADAPQAVRKTVRESVRQAVRLTAKPVRAPSRAVRLPALARCAPPAKESVRQPPPAGRLRDPLRERLRLDFHVGLRRRLRRDRHRRSATEFLLDHLLDRRVPEVVQVFLEFSREREPGAAALATGRVDGDRSVAHRTRHGGPGDLCRLILRQLGAETALPGEVSLPQAGMELCLEDPEARVVRIDHRETLEGLGPALRVIERRLRGREGEQGVRVPRVQFEALTGDLHDEPESIGSLGLRFEGGARRRRHGRRGLRGFANHLQSGVGQLEDPEGRVGRGLLEMEHANLTDDRVPDPGPLDFDQPVERLMEGR